MVGIVVAFDGVRISDGGGDTMHANTYPRVGAGDLLAPSAHLSSSAGCNKLTYICERR